MTPKNQSQVFFSKNLEKHHFSVLPLTQAGKTVLLTLVFVEGVEGVEVEGSVPWLPWLQFSKCHQNDATLGQLIRFNDMEEYILFVETTKSLGFFGKPIQTHGVQISLGATGVEAKHPKTTKKDLTFPRSFDKLSYQSNVIKRQFLVPSNCRCTATASVSSTLEKDLSKVNATPRKTKKNNRVTTPAIDFY